MIFFSQNNSKNFTLNIVLRPDTVSNLFDKQNFGLYLFSVESLKKITIWQIMLNEIIILFWLPDTYLNGDEWRSPIVMSYVIFLKVWIDSNMIFKMSNKRLPKRATFI